MQAELYLDQGRVVFMINGARTAPLLYSTSFLNEKQLRLFADCGVNLVSFPATADFHLYSLALPVWHGEGCYDYTEIDRNLKLIAEANPNAWIIPRVFTCSPQWWDGENPKELVVWDDGSSDRPLFHGAAKNTVPSIGSRLWREASVDNVRRLIRHVESGPYAERVVGYQVNSGNSEEWFHYGTMEGYLFDYNPSVEERFRSWLARKYESPESLSAAWNSDQGFESVTIPSPDERRKVDDLGCRHPKSQRNVIDFMEFGADLMADCIIEQARAVKKETEGKKVFGTFYGYLLELAYHPSGIQNGGHIALGRVLDEPAIDFIASPSSYARRLPGDGYSMSMAPSLTVNRHNKVFFHENDVRTHVLFDDAGYGRTDTAFEDRGIQFREFAHALTHGHGMWWFDMTSGWYDTPPLSEAVQTMVRITDDLASVPREGVAEIALVIDQESLLHIECPPNQLVHLISQQCLELSRAGTPFDTILLDDLESTSRYRMLLLPTLFHITDDKRDRLHGYLQRTGATAVFFLAPGIIGDESSDVESSNNLTGIKIKLTPERHFNIIETKAAGIPTTYGSWFWFDHTPQVIDKEATPLGTYTDTNLIGLARKEMPSGWTSIYSGAPAVAGRVLRQWATEAGVHLYTQTDDAIFACSTVIAIHARTTGEKTLKVPNATSLHDLIHEVTIRPTDGEFHIHLTRGDTAIFRRDKTT